MKNIGFIGLGAMGYPIAQNLQNAGFQLYLGCHVERSRAELLAQQGAVICDSMAEVARQSEVIFIVVPKDSDVEQVIFSGLWPSLRPGTIVIDLSTIDLVSSQDFARRLAEKGVHFLDAPISGGVRGAQDGTLVIMVGGDREICDRCAPLFTPIAKKVVYCGKNGMGLAAKAANNLIAAAEMAAISEAAALAVKAGIAPEDLFEVLKGGTANSAILQSKSPALLADDYSPKFRLELMCKDLGIITGTAKKLGSPAFVASTVEQLFSLCREEHGQKDSIAVSLFYQQHNGISFAARKEENK